MRDMQNFNKLSVEEQLAGVKNFIASYPASEHERLVREFIVRKEDQDTMIKELKQDQKLAEEIAIVCVIRNITL